MKPAKLLLKAMSAPQNLRFAELCRFAEAFGYKLTNLIESLVTSPLFVKR